MLWDIFTWISQIYTVFSFFVFLYLVRLYFHSLKFLTGVVSLFRPLVPVRSKFQTNLQLLKFAFRSNFALYVVLYQIVKYNVSEWIRHKKSESVCMSQWNLGTIDYLSLTNVIDSINHVGHPFFTTQSIRMFFNILCTQTPSFKPILDNMTGTMEIMYTPSEGKYWAKVSLDKCSSYKLNLPMSHPLTTDVLDDLAGFSDDILDLDAIDAVNKHARRQVLLDFKTYDSMLNDDLLSVVLNYSEGF